MTTLTTHSFSHGLSRGALNFPSRTNRNIDTLQYVLNHDPINIEPNYNRELGTNLIVNGVTVALKCPTQERDNVCLELLHDTHAGQWEDSWFMTCRADAYLWVLPEGAHLWVKRLSLELYEQHEAQHIPRTNHSIPTQERLLKAGSPCNVVTRWVPIDDVLDKTNGLRYNVEDYNPITLDKWLHDNFNNNTYATT